MMSSVPSSFQCAFIVFKQLPPARESLNRSLWAEVSKEVTHYAMIGGGTWLAETMEHSICCDVHTA
eukprot:scaffold98007_cov38-Attheya_sp.AAC.1